MEPKGSLPHSQVPATCPYLLYLSVLQIASHKTPLLSISWGEKQLAAMKPFDVQLLQCTKFQLVTHFKVLIHLNSLEENY